MESVCSAAAHIIHGSHVTYLFDKEISSDAHLARMTWWTIPYNSHSLNTLLSSPLANIISSMAIISACLVPCWLVWDMSIQRWSEIWQTFLSSFVRLCPRPIIDNSPLSGSVLTNTQPTGTSPSSSALWAYNTKELLYWHHTTAFLENLFQCLSHKMFLLIQCITSIHCSSFLSANLRLTEQEISRQREKCHRLPKSCCDCSNK